jgi:hypothetical protein
VKNQKQHKPIVSRTNLVVPFNERHLAKSKGAKWDIARKIWYVEDSFDDPKDIFDFVQWAPERLKKATTSGPLKHPPFVVVQPRTPRLKKKKRL